MIQMETVRRLLAAADVGKDAYAVAEASAALLCANASDVIARVHYARALAALGLGTAARRVIENVADIPDPLKGAIIAAPPGTTAWSSRARRFAANLAALAARFPQYADLFANWQTQSPNYELHLANDGNALVLSKAAPVWSGWIGGLNNHKAGASAWKFDKTKTPTILPVLFDGIGFGWLLPQVFATTAESFLQYSCAIHVFEPDPLALAIAMHVQDFQQLFSSPRFYLHAGANAENSFRGLLEKNLDVTIPGQIVVQPLTKRPTGAAQKIVEAAGEVRAAAHAAVKREIENHYAAKTPEFWAERLNAGKPLRVLGLTTRYSTVLRHSMEEMRQAACSLGHDFRVAIEADDSSLENPAMKMIAEFKPDVIFQLSRMRYENPNIPRNVPYICWDQDNLACMRTEAATQSLDRLTFVAGHGAVFGYGHLNWPAENCIFVHPAGATFRYWAEKSPAASPGGRGDVGGLACDLSYVSNAAEPPERLAERLAVRWARDAAFENAWAAAVEQVTAESRGGNAWDLLPLQQLVARINGNFTPAIVNEMAMDLKTLADRLFRHVALEWVSKWCHENGKTLKLYGKGWESHAAFAGHAAGSASQGEHLRAIYQASKINLQIIENGFIHSRSLDGLAAGGFFMTRRSAADGKNVEILAEIHKLGQWVNSKGAISADDVESSADPDVQRRWKLTQNYHPWTREHAFRVLKVWGDVPQPSVAFPELARISFGSAEEFGILAAKFLGDEGARLELARAMRKRVVEEFSYTARFEKMIGHMARQLAAPRIEIGHARQKKEPVLSDAQLAVG